MHALLESLKGKLIVSCQAYEMEPLHGSELMARMAQAAKEGGAAAIRANGPEDIRAIKRQTGLPVIGIWKKFYPDSDIYITPGWEEATEVLQAGADIIAIDATVRRRPGGQRLEDIVARLKQTGKALLMADVSTLEEGKCAASIGFDLVSTTLAGYTAYSRQTHLPDFELIAELGAGLDVPVIAEGRIGTPDQALRCLTEGAHCVVVGTAITRPHVLTEKFAEALRGRISV